MKRCLMVLGLLTVGGLASTAAPALSETSIRTQAEWSPVRLLDGPVDGRGAPVRLAQAEYDRGDRGPRRASDRGKDRAGPRDEARKMGRMGRHGHARHRQPLGLRIAERLAQTETYVGITSAQLDLWRAYSTALIDFFERPARDRGPGGPRPSAAPPPAAQGEAGAAPAEAAPVLFAERLADRAIERAERATALKTALDALRAELSPEQLDRLARAERAFDPHRGLHHSGRNDPRRGSRAGMQPMSSDDMPAASPDDMPGASPEDMSPETPDDMSPEASDEMPRDMSPETPDDMPAETPEE